jgi:MFS family permease
MWAAIAASSLGDGIFSVALPLLALEYTRSPLAISGVMVAGELPVVVAALPFGTLADRVNRRRLIVAIELTRFLFLALFSIFIILGVGRLPLIYLAAFLLGGLNIAFDVVVNASVPSVVPSRDLVRANAHLLNAELTSENLVGQALGGVAMTVSLSLPFVADAMAMAGSAALLNSAVPDSELAPPEHSAWHDSLEGLRWFVANPLLRLLTSLIASLAFCQGIVFGLLALYARQELQLGNGAYGLLLAAASIGTIFGGIVAPRLYSRLGSGMVIPTAGLAVAGAYLVLAFTHSPLLACAALLIQEFFVIVGNTASRSIRQLVVPDDMQGRAASANTMLIVGCFPIGALFGGAVAGATDIKTAFLMAAILQAGFVACVGPRLVRRTRTRSLTPS